MEPLPACASTLKRASLKAPQAANMNVASQPILP